MPCKGNYAPAHVKRRLKGENVVQVSLGYLNLKFAVWIVPSFNVTES